MDEVYRGLPQALEGMPHCSWWGLRMAEEGRDYEDYHDPSYTTDEYAPGCAESSIWKQADEYLPEEDEL